MKAETDIHLRILHEMELLLRNVIWRVGTWEQETENTTLEDRC